MINLEKMGFSSEEVLQRSQMKMIVGGNFYNCSCAGGPAFLVMAEDTDEAKDVAKAECGNDDVDCAAN